MMSLYNRYKWLRLTVGLILLLVGVLTIVISQIRPDIISTSISISIAVVLFLIGGFALFATLMNDKRSMFAPSLVISALFIAVGVILCIKTGFIGEIIVYFMAAFCIAFGVVELFKGIQLCKYKAKWYLFVLCFILAVIGIAFGVISLIYPGNVLSIIYILIGCLMIILGINEIFYGIKMLRK